MIIVSSLIRALKRVFLKKEEDKRPVRDEYVPEPIRALKRVFLKKEEDKRPVRLREVSNEELLGRLQRKMPLEHITCDEYIPVPKNKRISTIIQESDEKVVKVKIIRKKNEGVYRTGSYEAQIDADNHKSGYQCISTGSVKVNPSSISSGFTPQLLKEAIEDAKAVRETARINAELALNDAFDKSFKKNREYVINNTIEPVILPPKKDKISGLEIDEFDLNKIFAKRRVKVYDNEKW
jgi:hypothetical protein